MILVGQEPGTEFKEGPNIIRYKVYDMARNRAGCKFIVRIEGKFNPLNEVSTLFAILGQLDPALLAFCDSRNVVCALIYCNLS